MHKGVTAGMKVLVLAFGLVAAAAVWSEGREYEFSWDTGVWGACARAPTGRDAWFGNEFTLYPTD